MRCRLEFPESGKPTIELDEGDCLSEVLTVQNSPILFGCRIGICGTCAIEVEDVGGTLHPRTENEHEFLDTLAPGNKTVRLACQIHIDSHLKVKKARI